MGDLPRLVVVGGGSAGWITASYINSVANGRQPVVEVVLVESPNIARIGVGEATVPSIRETLSRIGYPEVQFLKDAEATFKNAILFKNWLHNEGEVYFHPFDQRQVNGRGDESARDWLASNRETPWADTVSILKHLCDANLSPKARNWPDYGSVFPYAYHMDAEKFATSLAGFSKARGVRHILADVENVSMSDSGSIEAVHLNTGDRIDGDFFVDCTGFSALLIEKALGGKFVDFSDWLICDRAVAMRVPYDIHRPDAINPYTISKAMSAGWAWDIPLQTRRGRGYVYSSKFLDGDAAEAELRADEGEHAHDLPARHLKFKVGHREQAWIGNCVAIGLSSGFIEPLESSALYTVEASVAALLEHLDFSELSNLNRNRIMSASYNRNIVRLYEEILEFVNLHYCLSQRDDSPFWREVRRQDRIVPTLAEKLSVWAHKPPTQYDFDTPLQLFSLASYEYILFGMRKPSGKSCQACSISPELQTQIEKSKAKMPPHDAWFTGG